ncbi:MAG TPA: four helix bundle protein [Bacteroidales bacterium]|nr:four helix bundle protein [Bacteroidales bacterium]
MSEIKTHKDLIVWQKSVAFVTEIYKFTKSFPDEEKFGIISQLRRASVSIPVNYAEGAARHSRKEYIQFLYVFLGSVSEIDTLLIISGNLNYSDRNDLINLQTQSDEIKKILTSLIKSLNNS